MKSAIMKYGYSFPALREVEEPLGMVVCGWTRGR